MKKQTTKGYKVTDKELSCRSFKFELNKKFKETGSLKICENGFHFCSNVNDCFNYYTFDSKNRVFEILAYGNIDTNGDKSCTLEIELTRELTWLEVLELCNMGKNNTGRSNTGYSNTGDRNTGYSNTGDWNTGDRNTGYSNTGDRNTGDRNTGDWNTGYSNTGDWNTGDWNTGDRNTGDRNTGYSNTGYSNTGDWNTGDRNTGYSNTGDRNTGVFCTGEKTIKIFDVDSGMTIEQFKETRAFNVLQNYLETKIWIPEYKMTHEEKTKFPAFKTAEGYIKDIPIKEAWSNMWGNLSDFYKNSFKELPNFNSDIFEKITGIKI